MARRRLILVPPSEGKALGGEGPPWLASDGAADHPLHDQRLEVSAALSRQVASARSVESLLGVSGEALQRAVDADSTIDSAPTLPAIERYDGVLYQHLDAASMTPGQRRRLARSLRIISGLWGVVAPDELIPDYRLKMSASLDGIGKLSTWWRPFVSALLASEARAPSCGTYCRWSIQRPSIRRRACQEPPCSSHPTGPARLVPVSHWNKALKGALVSHLVRNPSAGPEDLVDWEHPAGYRLDPDSLVVSDRVRVLRFVADA
ncbi:MAG: peroxide stress protein YaaA [Microthrixaceae bacterium]